MSELTNEDVMEALGWYVGGVGESLWIHDDLHGTEWKEKPFSPTTNTDDALALVPEGYGVNLDYINGSEAIAAIYLKKDWLTRHNVHAYGEATLPLAICKALIELTQKEK